MNIVSTKAYHPNRVSKHIVYLMSHQASSAWTPDEDRMSRAVLNRLAEAHGVMGGENMDPMARARYYCMCKKTLDNGYLLVSKSMT